MNKKIAIIAMAIVVVAVTTIGIKTIFGDSATELPGEEHSEKALNIQEVNQSSGVSTESGESGSTESSESGP